MLAGLAVALTLGAYARHVYPVPSNDSSAFVPPAILFAAGQGLRDPLSSVSIRPGDDRYLQYPPLFPLAVGLLMREPNPQAAFAAIGALAGMDALLLAWLLGRIIRRQGRGGPGSAALAGVLALLAAATNLVGEQTGRPEVLAALWALLAAHAGLTLPPQRSWWIIGPLMGLTGATHPMAGLLLGLLQATHLAARLPARRALVAIGSTAVSAAAVFLAALALSPFGIMDILAGTAHHAQLAVLRGGSNAQLADYWVRATGATFYALPFLLLASSAAARALLQRRMPPLLSVIFALLLGAVIWYAGVRIPEHAYNLLLFAPGVFAANLHLLLSATGLERRLLIAATSVAHGLAAIGFLRSVALFGIFLGQGVSLAAARGEVSYWVSAARGKIAVTSSLWVLSEDYRRLEILVGPAGPEVETVVLQQNYSGRLTPPELPGFTLRRNTFRPSACRVFGLLLANTVPGYSYGLYTRDSPPGDRPLMSDRRPAVDPPALKTGRAPDFLASPQESAGAALVPAARRARGTLRQ
ncbi:MAG TPA: hypothetical protein VOA80_12725 [Thermoanaerobaculia bacterium]|nr:hypothetical protein [Thermoanaerobaculia bacterium]